MELKRVEIIGFKSFPEKIWVEFDRGITAIVGPNGSGKSNIADAVRWVLGEQSAKSLRGSKMEDVIFAGTERRRPLGFAEVTLVLDNRDKKIPVDYDEVQIRRRLFRSGESEYAINGSKCRLKDIQEMIMDTGIGKDGYSMIGQGQIDRLLSSKPQDRRMIFEEAAGITKYKTRREQAEKKLEEESAQLVRVSDILGELSLREETLKEQAETAKTYLGLREELKVYEVSAFLGEYDQLKRQSDRAKSLLEENEVQLTASRAKRDEAREKSSLLQQSVKESRDHLSEIEAELTNLKLEQEKREGDKRVLEGKLEQSGESVRQLILRLQEIKERVRDRLATLDKEQKNIEALEETIQSQEQEVANAEAEVAKAQNRQKSTEEVLVNLQKENARLKNEKVEASLALERIQMIMDQEKQKEADFEGEKDRLSEAVNTLTAAYEEKSKTYEAASKKNEQQSQALADLKEQRTTLTQNIQTIRQKQEGLLLQMKDLKRRQDFLRSMQNEYEGFSGPVRSVMKLAPQFGSRIRGTFSDIFRVDEQYVTAIEMAAGAAVQNIVVEDSNTAKELVEYLRKNEMGRATFLPIDSVIGRSHTAKDDEIRRMQGVIGFADEIVQADPIYQKIIQRQLGNVVVVETFDQARNVSRRHGTSVRVVTLKGDIFNIGGSITGGSTKQKSQGILSRKKELDEVADRMKAMRDQADENQKQLTSLNETSFTLDAQIREKTQEGSKASEVLTRAALESSQAEYEKNRAKEELELLLEQEEERLKTGGEKEKEIIEKQETLAKVDQALGANEAAVAAAQEEAKNAMATWDQEREELGRKNVALAGSRHQKSFLAQSMEWEEKEIENLNQEMDQILDTKAQSETEDQNILAEIKNIESDIAKKAQDIENKAKEKALLEAKTQEADTKRESSIQEVEEALHMAAQLEKEQIRLQNQSEKAENDLKELMDRMWDDYEITIGSAREMSENGFGNDEKLQEAAALSKTKRHAAIVRIKNAIKELGPVNVHAVEEYKALTERIEFLTTQKNDIEESQKNLEGIIERMTLRMEKQFKEGFEKIALSFNKVFQQMFGGGQAVLRLTEGDDSLEAGVEITVQPPGKKLQSMMLLSGGERALTAIALLFAIQELNPAPFCILDEIEAALDDANVDRFANFLEHMCDSTQFIVITHRKGTMSVAHTLYGVTMEEKGVSKCVSVLFDRN